MQLLPVFVPSAHQMHESMYSARDAFTRNRTCVPLAKVRVTTTPSSLCAKVGPDSGGPSGFVHSAAQHRNPSDLVKSARAAAEREHTSGGSPVIAVFPIGPGP